MSLNKDTTEAFKQEVNRRWFEPATAVLLAIASLSTVWCSYQDSRWSGQSGAFGDTANRLERQALAMRLEAKQIESVQARMMMEIVNAHLAGDSKREKFYVDRIGGEFKPAYAKWIALNPYEDPAAPPHPFVPQLYTPHFAQEIKEANEQAVQANEKSNITGKNAAGYLSNTVLLATVLFFAGTAGKFDQRRVRLPSLCFAVMVYLYAAFKMLMLPVT